MGAIYVPSVTDLRQIDRLYRDLEKQVSYTRNNQAQSNGTDLIHTSRLREAILNPCEYIRLRYDNFYTPSGGNENINNYNVTVTAGVENPDSATGDSTGASVIPVTFNGGSPSAVMSPGSFVISDPVVINGAGQVFVRSCATVANTEKFPTGRATQNTAFFNDDYSGGSEGVTIGSDATKSGAISGSTTSAFQPTVIMGYSNKPTPSVYGLIDSIVQGTGLIKPGHTWMNYACIVAGFPYCNAGIGSYQFNNYITTKNSQYRRRNYPHFSHIGDNGSINDINASVSLATMKSNKLAEWKRWYRAGKGILVFPILPCTTSTTGWMDVAGQTVRANEATRVGYNAWVRDTSASGAKAQFLAANPTAPYNTLTVIDICVPVEVNASNVLTQDGGFWLAPTTTVTGTLTGYSGSTATDSTQSRTPSVAGAVCNGDSGFALFLSSGTGAGQTGQVSSNTATAWTLTAAYGTPPVSGTGYVLGANRTIDGTHPNDPCHVAIGAYAATFLANVGLISD